MTKKDGFTLIELLVILVMLTVMIMIAMPGFSSWLPEYKLKNAARDLYSNMQLTKMEAIKTNTQWAIIYDTGATPGKYYLCSEDGANDTWDGPAAMGGDDALENTIDLSDYEKGITFGHGSAAHDISGGTFPSGNITYTSNIALFNPKGTSNGGYVYFENNKHTTTYSIGSLTTGVILLRRWTGTAWE